MNGSDLKRSDGSDASMNPVQVYRVSKSWKIFFAVGLPPFVALFMWIAALPFLQGRSGEIDYVLLCFIFGIGMALLLLGALFEVFRVKLQVYPDRIRAITFRGTRELFIDEISGFRVVQGTLLLLPKDPKTKKIKTQLIFEKKATLFEWLNQNLTNLDSVDYQQQVLQMLDDTRLGETREQRLWVINRACMWSRVLNGIGFASALWAILKPEPHPYLVWTLILSPLVVLVLMRRFHGVLKFNEKPTSPFPDVSPAFIAPCIGLGLLALRNFDILSWNDFWLPFTVFSLLSYCLTLISFKDLRRQIGNAVALLLFCAVYGCSAVIILNGVLDKSTPTVYRPSVIEKRVCKGKHTSHYLKLSSWGPRKDGEEVDVGKSTYDKHEVGDVVEVLVREGKLGIPWYCVR